MFVTVCDYNFLLALVFFFNKFNLNVVWILLRLTPWDNNLWLDVNYLELAKAAQHCGAFLTSILYTEIAATDLDM